MVWAEENTRDAIFEALKRKETYGTSGPRMKVRFFGGWNYPADACGKDFVDLGYKGGVPMGGDLPARTARTGAPTFITAAIWDDQIRTRLQQIQIIKGWVDAAGETREQVYDVVWSDDRAPGADGKVPLVGDTVDLANATWTNSIGASVGATFHREDCLQPSPDQCPVRCAWQHARNSVGTKSSSRRRPAPLPRTSHSCLPRQGRSGNVGNPRPPEAANSLVHSAGGAKVGQFGHFRRRGGLGHAPIVELHREARLACRDGMSERAAARHLEISRESVATMPSFGSAGVSASALFRRATGRRRG